MTCQHRLGVVRIDFGLCGKVCYIFPIFFLGIAVNQRTQRGVGLDDAGVDAEVAALEQPVLAGVLEDDFRCGLIDGRAEAAADDAETGVVGLCLFEAVTEESAQRKLVGTAAGDGAFAG